MSTDSARTLLQQAPDDSSFRLLVDKYAVATDKELWAAWRKQALQQAYSGNSAAGCELAALLIRAGDIVASSSAIAMGHWIAANVLTVASQPSGAQRHYQIAEQHYVALDDLLSLARMRVGIVAMHNQLGQHEQALAVAEQALTVLSKSADASDQQRCGGLANNRAIAFERLGRYEEAIENYQAKITVWQQWSSVARASAEIARARINIGVLKLQLNLFADAERHLLAGKQVLLNSESAARYQLDIARAEMQLAHLDACCERPTERVRAAFDAARKRCIKPDMLLGIDLYECEWELAKGNVSAELGHKLKALHKRLLNNGSTRDALRAQILRGRYFLQQGHYHSAESTFAAALTQAQAMDDWDNRYRAKHGLGLCYIANASYEQGEKAFLDALSTIESIDSKVQDVTQRAGFREDKLTVYQDLIALYWGRDSWEGSFAIIERARAQHLSDTLGKGNSLGLQQSLTLEALRQLLPLNTLLIVFVQIRDQLWAWPIANDNFYAPLLVASVADFTNTEGQLRHIADLNQKPQRIIERHYQQLIGTANDKLAIWYRQLFAPLDAILARYSNLLICPDGPLWRLPIHAAYDAHSSRYLAETHTVRYIPSSSTWLQLQQRRRSSRLAIGLGYNGSQLTHAAREVEEIAQVYGQFECYLGSAATCALMRSTAVQSADILHIAAHAVFRSNAPQYSYIELADGRLEMNDVMQLKLTASLVVLSACDTGQGMTSGGEFLGLANGFLLAGARCVLVTQWRIDDHTSAELMTHFYDGLAQNLSVGSALNRAQELVRHSPQPQRAHPYYWAPYYLLGYDPLR